MCYLSSLVILGLGRSQNETFQFQPKIYMCMCYVWISGLYFCSIILLPKSAQSLPPINCLFLIAISDLCAVNIWSGRTIHDRLSLIQTWRNCWYFFKKNPFIDYYSSVYLFQSFRKGKKNRWTHVSRGLARHVLKHITFCENLKATQAPSIGMSNFFCQSM